MMCDEPSRARSSLALSYARIRNKTGSLSPANAFCGRNEPPTAKELAATLGNAKSAWEQLLSDLASELNLVASEWGSSSPELGWSLRVKNGDRIILYMAPLQGCFRVSYVLGDNALQAALASGLPAPMLALIRDARKYAEGTAVRIDVVKPGDLETVKKLARAKLGK